MQNQTAPKKTMAKMVAAYDYQQGTYDTMNNGSESVYYASPVTMEKTEKGPIQSSTFTKKIRRKKLRLRLLLLGIRSRPSHC
ncbi:unnamed protein product [Caenorhabditis sp. 36 PRJEB53466]|nr:unnamed protein product [Caenorhabditis sp. 36 PRJEB53466]